jgi:hypothetical protein
MAKPNVYYLSNTQPPAIEEKPMNRLLLSAGLAVLATACTASAAERSFPATAFQRVAASGSEDVVISTGKVASVVATGPQERLDRLDIRVEGDTLKIGHKSGASMSWGKDDVVIHVTMPALLGVKMAGSGDVTADKGSGPAFAVSLAGSGDIRVADIDTQTATFSTAGSGDIRVAGRCTSAKISISGSGDIDAAALKCADVEIGVNGSGDVMAHATRAANIRVSGSGDVRISGGAKCQSRTSGSGSVSCG